jgi:hypothetical protein
VAPAAAREWAAIVMVSVVMTFVLLALTFYFFHKRSWCPHSFSLNQLSAVPAVVRTMVKNRGSNSNNSNACNVNRTATAATPSTPQPSIELPPPPPPPVHPPRLLHPSLVRYKDQVGAIPDLVRPTPPPTPVEPPPPVMLSSIPIAHAVPVADDELSPRYNDGDDPRDERLRELELQMRALRRLVRAGQDSEPVTTTTPDVSETPNHEPSTTTRDASCTSSCTPWSSGRKMGALGLVGIIIVISIAAATTTRPVADPTQPSTLPPPVRTPTVATRTGSPREKAILEYLNAITLTEQTLSYPDNATAEGRAVQWLVDDDLSTAPSNKLLLRQRYVLATIWYQQGPFNTGPHVETWTNTNLNECDWYDVVCGDGDTRIVTSLTLQSNGVNGRLPHDLGLLTALTRLELAENRISGTIPATLGNLTALTHFDLSFNGLTGTIPSSLSALTALTVLDLSGNLLDGTIPSSLAAMTALTVLDLSGNTLNGTIPSSLAALTDLQTLDLSFNWLNETIISSFAALTALDHLFLSYNQLDGTIPSSLAALTALEYLYLEDNQLSGTIPSSLAALTALEYLRLENNQLSGTVPFCNGTQRTQSFAQLSADCDKVSCRCCTCY